MARTLSVVILGDSASVEKAFAKSAAAAETFAGKVDAVGARTAAIGKTLTTHLTLPVVALGGLATKAAVDFQNAMELIHTQAGLPQKDVAALSAGVLKLSSQVGVAPSTLAVGLFHVVSQGVKGTAEQLDVLKTAAEGSAMGQADMEDATNALGAVMFSNLRGIKNTTQAMGQMNAIVGAGDMHFQDLADAFGTKLLAVMQSAGVSLKQGGAALAIFGDQNIRGADAGTMLGSAIQYMIAPSGAANASMKKLGLSGKKLADDIRSGCLLKALTDVHDVISKLPKDEQQGALVGMFTKKGGTGVQILLNQLDRMPGKLKAIDAGGSKFAADWSDYTKTTAFKMNQMGASMQSAGVTIGDILLPVVSKVVNAISDLANKFGSLPSGVQKAILVFAGIAAAIGPVVSVVGNLTKALGFLAANPIVLVVAAVAALVAAFVAAVVWPDKLRAVLERMGLSAHAAGEIVDGMRAVFERLKQAGVVLVGAIRDHWDQITSVVKAAGDMIKRAVMALVGVIRSNWGTISAIVKGEVDIITTVIRTYVNMAKALWREFGSYIVTYLKNVWELVKATIKNALTVIRGIIDVVTGLIHGDWGRVWQGIKEIVGGAFSEIEALLAYFGKQWANVFAAVGKVLGQVGGKIKAAFADAGSWLLDAGKQIIAGLLNGMESMEKTVLGYLGGLKDKALGVLKGAFHINSPSRDMIPIGSGIMEGIQAGMTMGWLANERYLTSIAGQIKAKMTAAAADVARMTAQQTAEQNKEQDAQNQAALKNAKTAKERADALQTIRDTAAQRELTKAQAHYTALQNAYNAAQQKMQAAQQKAQQKLQQFQQAAGTAFDRLAQKIKDAFQAKNDAYVSPAQQQINDLMAPFNKQDLDNAITDAANAVTDAQDQLNAMLADTSGNTTPQQIAEQRQSLLEAQQNYQRAVVNLQVNGPGGLADQAAAQDKAHQEQVAAQQDTLDTMLANLRTHLTTTGDTWNTAMPAILKIIQSYDGSFSDIGNLLGDSFSKSLMAAVNAAIASARSVAQANGAKLPSASAPPQIISEHGQGQNYTLNIANVQTTNAKEIPRMFRQMEALAA